MMIAMKATTTQFFKGFPESSKLFRMVRDHIQTLGPIKIDVLKTQISFAAKKKFAWAWLPQRWTSTRPKGSIVLSFALSERIQNHQIAESVEVSTGKWMHHVVLRKASDLDPRVKKWIREAYEEAR